MKNDSVKRLLHGVVLLAWGLFAVLLTTQSDKIPVVALMISTIGSTEIGATIGHAGLFGFLAVLCYLALVTFMRRHAALLVTVLVVILIATATELFQTLVYGRDTSLSDLLANWLGVFMVSFGIAYRAMQKHVYTS